MLKIWNKIEKKIKLFWNNNRPVIEKKVKLFWNNNCAMIEKNWKVFDDITAYGMIGAGGVVLSCIMLYGLSGAIPNAISGNLGDFAPLPWYLQIILVPLFFLIIGFFTWVGVKMTYHSGKNIVGLVRKLDFTPS